MGITNCRLKLINSCIHPLTWHSFIFHAEIAWSSSLPLLEDEEQKAARTARVAVLWHISTTQLRQQGLVHRLPW